jgi:Smr domain
VTHSLWRCGTWFGLNPIRAGAAALLHQSVRRVTQRRERSTWTCQTTTSSRTESIGARSGKLKRGDYIVRDRRDLHGMTAAEALVSIEWFIENSRHRGHRCVRIIHGRGLHSKGNAPSVKGARTEAPASDGGSGAVYCCCGSKSGAFVAASSTGQSRKGSRYQRQIIERQHSWELMAENRPMSNVSDMEMSR